MKKMHEYNKTNDSLAEYNKRMELMGSNKLTGGMQL